MKLTLLTIIPGSILGVLLLEKTGWRLKFCNVIIFGLFAVLGFVIIQGYWMWQLWQVYGNPLFPYFNLIFHSPFLDNTLIFDQRFLAHSWWAAFLFPVLFSFKWHYVSENYFREIRFAILYLLGFGSLLWVLLKKQVRRFFKLTSLEIFIWGFFLITFIFWEATSGIYRYLIGLEILTPLLLLMLWQKFTPLL